MLRDDLGGVRRIGCMRCTLRLANLGRCELLLLLGLVHLLLPPLQAMLQGLNHPLLRHRHVRSRDLLGCLKVRLHQMVHHVVHQMLLAELLLVSLHQGAVPGEPHLEGITSNLLLILLLLGLRGLDAVARNELSELLLGSLLHLLHSLLGSLGTLLRELGFCLQHLLQTWVPPLGLRVLLLVFVPDLHSDTLKVVLLLSGLPGNMLRDDLGGVRRIGCMRCTLRLANLCGCELLLALGLTGTLLPPLQAMLHRLQHLVSCLLPSPHADDLLRGLHLRWLEFVAFVVGSLLLRFWHLGPELGQLGLIGLDLGFVTCKVSLGTGTAFGLLDQVLIREEFHALVHGAGKFHLRCVIRSISGHDSKTDNGDSHERPHRLF